MTAAQYKQRREALGYTQQSLAAVLGVARETIARRETDVIPITIEAALALSALPKAKVRPPRPQNAEVSHDQNGEPKL